MGGVGNRKGSSKKTEVSSHTVDIRIIKKELRQKYRSLRENMTTEDKKCFDDEIASRVIDFPEYKSAKTLLCFVSTDLEVNTLPILEDAFKSGKNVAVPRCVDKDGKMEFHLIKGMGDLEPSTFGLLEPNPDRSPVLTDFKASVCILPGFGFDKFGYRIGFGKGYYDRFLQKYKGIKIGICYNACIGTEFPHGRYDAAADYVVTQKYIMTINKMVRIEDEA